ncbi:MULTISPECIES: ExbD/TolR family protein [Asticcacaulis]|jgi:TonB system transport protein ExbD (group 1)|uniref:Biopolymer transport protein ExbD/TolR n=2 Tax=Asticcacaulis excentricus TaxID=78587 RepID=E8RQA3_ASTEC|nr:MULTISPECIES: biopolymer transporter ExbD [Asticcacaulis]ADU13205.1 Biopolymer transport protein ExbD/TolR [Asticcacaulis excentricus CB 48]MCA1935969.1 biopolymer transporter ExbD [Asticcacaulis sp.]BBF80399.1 biopolymer transport protein ExbD [Asticcacaulis excentricus]
MGAKLSSGSGGSKFHIEQNSEINVTPFVDIMLVLLIIFMVAAPMASVSIEVNLPTAVAPPQQNPPKPIYISIQQDGGVFIGDKPTSLADLGADMKIQVGKRDPDKERIFIRCDRKTRYADFMQVMNALQDNGYYSVALIGEDGNK